MLKVNDKNIERGIVLDFSLSRCFTPFSSVSIVDFEQVNVNWLSSNAHFKNTVYTYLERFLL